VIKAVSPLRDKYTRRDATQVSDSIHEHVDLVPGPLRPMPEHVFDALLTTLRESLGERWGTVRAPLPALRRAIRSAVDELEGVYLAAELARGAEHGLRLQLWVDRADLDLVLADEIVEETLRGFGDREILLVCRTFEDDGLHYRFASGTVETALAGTIVLVGPYARDAAHLARIGSGQPLGFNA
jgi:hypothetical protein